MTKSIIAAIMLALVFTACKKDDNPGFDNSVKGDLTVEFGNVAGASDLELNSGTYTNKSGEDFKVTELKYYVSNFVVTKMDGCTYTVPQDSSYFLIDESNEESHEPLLHVPEGEYKSISFLIGVDSLRSISGIAARTGVLNPTGEASDMYTTLNTGYIFFKLDGSSTASASMGGNILYHIGGYGGYSAKTINNIKTITLGLTARGTPKVKAGKETNIHLFVDVLAVFDGPTTVSIAEHPMVMFDDFSTTIANNYATMIRHDHTEN